MKLKVVDTEALGLITPNRWEPYLEKKGWTRNHNRTFTVPHVHCYELEKNTVFLPYGNPTAVPGSIEYGCAMEVLLDELAAREGRSQLEILVDLIGLHPVLSRLSGILQLVDAAAAAGRPPTKQPEVKNVMPPAPPLPLRGWDDRSRDDIILWKNAAAAGGERKVRSQTLADGKFLVTLSQTKPAAQIKVDGRDRRRALLIALERWRTEYA